MDRQNGPNNGEETTPQDSPTLFALTRQAGDYRLVRRDFLKFGTALAAAATAAGCASLSGGKKAALRAICGKMLDSKGAPAKLQAHSHSIAALALTSTGRLLASASLDQTIKLWSLPDGKCLGELTGHEDGVRCLAITPDGKTLVSGGLDKTVRLWSLPDGGCERTLEVQSGGVWSVAVSHDGTCLAAGGGDGNITVWSLPRGRKIRTWNGHANIVTGLVFAPDGATLVSSSTDKSLRCWSYREGTPVSAVSAGQPVRCLALAADGKGVSHAGPSGVVTSRALPQFGVTGEVTRHDGLVSCLVSRPKAGLYASGGVDGLVKVWRDAKPQEEHRLAGAAHSIEALVLSPDGLYVFAGDSGGRIHQWELDGDMRHWVLFDPALLPDQEKLSGAKEERKISAQTICTCDLVCTCNLVYYPSGRSLPLGAVCVCNTIVVGPVKRGGVSETTHERVARGQHCSCDTICTCNTVCTCNTISRPSSSSGGGGRYYGGGHYWYPS